MSCLLVLFGHTQGTDGATILPPFVIAMDLFFALSGFLISGLLLSELESSGTVVLSRFWLRRIYRLFPAFYVFYGVGALAYAITGFRPIVGASPWISLASAGLYVSNWSVAFGHKLGIYTITWSLSLEEQFYVLCPLFLIGAYRYLGKRMTAVLFVFLILGVNVYRAFLFENTLAAHGLQAAWDRCYSALDTRMDSLLIGGFAALLLKIYGERLKVGARIGTLAFGLIFAILTFRNIPLARGVQELSPHVTFMMYGGFSVVAVLCSLTILHVVGSPDSLVARFLSNRVFTTIGILSYSVYLWHTAIFGGLDILLASFGNAPLIWGARTLLKFGVLAGIATLSYRFVETPFSRRRRA